MTRDQSNRNPQSSMSLMGMHTSVDRKTVGHFNILEQLGHGGMGQVYRAQDTRLDRVVALKFLPPWYRGHPVFRARLTQEAKCASALNHPNIVTVHEFGHIEDVDFIVMEYVTGCTLGDLLRPDGLPVGQTLDYAVQIAEALSAAHGAGILHGDLKPANIMVTPDGRVKLLDFGLATALASQATGAGQEPASRFGTTGYMAPERREHRVSSTPRSEIFSFGLILHEMLGGQHAFGDNTTDKTADSVTTEEPQPLPSRVPTSLAAVVRRCLRRDPEGRFESVRDLLTTLKECSAAENSGVSIPVKRPVEPPSDHAQVQLVQGIVQRLNYKNVAKSRQALAELGQLLENLVSDVIREAITAAMKDFLLSVDDEGNGLPASYRELRTRAVDVLRASTGGDLRCCFEGETIEHLDLYGMNFGSCQLTGVSFKSSFLVGSKFQGANLIRASFAGAYVRNVDFAGAELSGADFTDADWFNCFNLTESQVDSIPADTMIECPPDLEGLYGYLKRHYGFPFESWAKADQEQLKAAWVEHLRPGGLRDLVTRRTTGQ